MIAAILCPGQSLMQTWPNAGPVYDLVLTVNTAGKLIQGDWLCAGDKSFFRGLLGDCPRPRSGILCTPESVYGAIIWGAPDIAGSQVIGWPEVPLIEEHTKRGRPINWTVQSALCFAAHLGTLHVDLYGADGAASTSTIDASGYRGEDRTAERWAREESDLSWTRTILAEFGTTVNRIAP